MVKTALVNISIILFSLFVGLVALEGVVRVFHLESGLFSKLDSCVGHKNIPGKTAYFVSSDFKTYVSFNNQGFRDINHKVAKNNQFRIVMLGDSFTEGLQVPQEQVFPKQLEALLLASGKDVEVISLGVSSYGTDQSLLALECYGLLFKPDLIILSFVDNDVSDNYFETALFNPKFNLIDGELVLDTSYRADIKERLDNKNLSISFRFLKFIKDHSFLARLVKNKIQILSVKLRDDDVPYDKIFNRIYDEETEKAWLLTQALIVKIANTASTNDAEFLLVEIPTHPEYGKRDQSLNTDEIYDFSKPRRILNDFANKNNIQYLDLLPLFEDIGSVSFKDVSWPHDGHFNQKGHELTAQFIHNYIITHEMVL